MLSFSYPGEMLTLQWGEILFEEEIIIFIYFFCDALEYRAKAPLKNYLCSMGATFIQVIQDLTVQITHLYEMRMHGPQEGSEGQQIVKL